MVRQATLRGTSWEMAKWFCNSCKSLNASGAKKCYSCGAREDYLGLDGLAGIPVAPVASVVPATRGSSNVSVAPGGAPDGEMAFAGSRQKRPSKPLGRTSRRGVAALAVSAAVLVAVIVAVSVLGIGRGPVMGSPGRSGATPLPTSSLPSSKPSHLASPASSSQPSVTPAAGATPGLSASPAEVAWDLIRVVSDPGFSGHADMGRREAATRVHQDQVHHSERWEERSLHHLGDVVLHARW